MAGAPPPDSRVAAPSARRTVRLLWVAPEDLDAWTGALDTAGFDVRSARAADSASVTASLRYPLDLVVAWDDAAGARAGEVVARVREAGAGVPTMVVAHPAAEHGPLGGLEAGRPRALPAELARLLDQDWSRTRLALTGRIAHELNNLLAPIPLAVQLLRQPGDTSVSNGQLQVVETATRRSMGAVKELSALLAADEPVPLPVLAKHLLNLAAAPWRSLGARAPTVLTEYPPGLAGVRVELRPFLQVLWCLARRALDEVGGGAELPAELLFAGGSAALSAAPDAAGVELRVAAAPPAGLDGRAAAGAARAPLPGDDLASIMEIVEAHGGEVGVLEGSRKVAGYVVRLPTAGPQGTARMETAGRTEVSRPRPDDPPAARRRARTSTGDSVLLIEGDGELRRRTCEILERSGRTVLAAADGTEGVALFAQHLGEVGVVLVDMGLPVMDGMATIRALRRIGDHVPMVLTAGEDWDARRLESGPEAPDAVLRKPYDAESLLRALV